MYRLTPSRASEKLRLAKAYLERKEAEYEAIRTEIAILRAEVALELSNETASKSP